MDSRIAIRTCAGLRALALAAVAAIVLQLVVLPPNPAAHDVIAVSSDKFVHAAVFATLAFLLWIASRGRGSLLILAGIAAIGCSDELVQFFRPDRTADLLDLVADLVGAATTLFLLNRFARAAVPVRATLSRNGG